MHNQPSGAAFDVVLLLHVACVVVGIVTVATAAATARRLGRLVRTAAPLPEPLRRYFRPGVNWAGRTIYGIPVFGFALLGHEPGRLRAGRRLGAASAWSSSSPSRSWPRVSCGRPSGASSTPSRRPEPLPRPDPNPVPAPRRDRRSETVAADAARMERAASVALGPPGRGDRPHGRPALSASAHQPQAQQIVAMICP